MDRLYPLPKAGSLFRQNLKHENFEKLLLQLFLIGLVSVPVTIVALTFVFRLGHTTVFPPSDPHSGWSDSPDTRGSFNVIWICLSTIFTCVYISVHVGVAAVKSVNTDRTWQIITLPALRKVYWLLFNIFAPELMVLVALCELQSAIAGVAFMKRRKVEGWKIRHAFFADMGGFKLANGVEFRKGTDFYEWFDQERPELNFHEIETDIRDRSKANTVLKVLTCLQASWFLIETIMRFGEDLPVSELEVTTCTYIVCAIVTYGCWLRKPYGVDGRITLHTTTTRNILSSQVIVESPVDAREVNRISAYLSPVTAEGTASAELPLRTKPSTAFSWRSLSPTLAEVTDPEKARFQPPEDLPRPLFPNATTTPFNRAYRNPNRSWFIACHISSCVGAFIGIFHAVAFWNTRFVNTQGQWIWRACSLTQVAVPVALVFVTFIEYLYCGIFLWGFLLFLALVYCIARTALFALIWMSFKSLPTDVYRNVHWSWNFVPQWN
ncbi:hypothetical protein SCHPADRAFT_993126 [Schizopora paradoxa]|uniref:Uncharacterized protein n=1 Tax=Schizopora paradoxa TaxID=27342 RepID=A0A0H2S4M3_9AGAM|nr:hypothetical protein SCHPADRAFT_993126 [Schizopora paradoxa]